MKFLSVNFKFNDTVVPMKKANWVNFTELLLLHFISPVYSFILFTVYCISFIQCQYSASHEESSVFKLGMFLVTNTLVI